MRKVRRFGEEFAVAADRSLAKKFTKSQRKQPPGAHGHTMGFRKYTGYGLQLREKQKARVLYHVSESQMRRYYDMASARSGSASENFLQILESRLDNVVYRAGWAESHPQARQLVAHRQLAVNGQKVSIPSRLIKPGDIIEFVGKSTKLKDAVSQVAKGNKAPDWLKVDTSKLQITVNALPTRAEIDLPLDETLIIEFYSR